MIAGTSSRGDSRGARNAAARKPLSCTSCRQRKVKCDKTHPCDPCLKVGIECTFPTRRIRAPRGKPDAVEVRDAELLQRISRLEELLASNGEKGPAAANADSSQRLASSYLLTPLSSNGEIDRGSLTGVTVDSHYAAFVKDQGSSSRHLNNDFWSSLSNEFDGLRQLIEGDVEDDEDDDDSQSPPVEITDTSSSIIFQDPNNYAGAEVLYPSNAHSTALFQVYFSNFDPICKILHQPTVNSYFANLGALLDPSTQRFKFRSLEAVSFAAYFAAVNTMSPDECLTRLGEQKEILLARFKSSTEIALVQADFLNSVEISTLQALTVYIVVQSSLNNGRSSWTLIGLAARIAQGLNLHRDGDGRAFSAFEAEMRRRLWWQILALDMRVSQDRGAEPTLAETSFSTTKPCNIDDENFSYDTQHPLQSRTGPTEMTLSLLCMDALLTARNISSRLFTHDSNDLTLQETEEMVKQYGERAESNYLAHFNPTIQQTRLIRLMSHYWMCKLWLALYYPLQHRISSQKAWSRSQGLQTAVTFLNVNDLIEHDPSTVSFAWHLSASVPWHAVAVMLAELCNQPQNPLADRAWEIVQTRFEDWNTRVADVKEAMLWGPVKKLLKRAQAARQRSRESITVSQALQPPDFGSLLQGFDAPNTSSSRIQARIGSGPSDCQTFSEISLADPNVGQFQDFFAAMPADATMGNAGESGPPNDFDNWNDFMFDVNALGEEFPQESYFK